MADSLCQYSTVFVRVWVATAVHKRASAIKIICYCLQSKNCVTQKLCMVLFKFATQKEVPMVRVHKTSPRLFEKRACCVLFNWLILCFVLSAHSDGLCCHSKNWNRLSPWPGQSLAWVDKLHATFLGTWQQAPLPCLGFPLLSAPFLHCGTWL